MPNRNASVNKMIATAVCKQLLVLSRMSSCSGAVHSVFDHAVNLEIGGRYGFIGLIAQQKALTPYAVSVRVDSNLLSLGIRTGTAAAIQEGKVFIPEAGIELDLAQASVVDLSLDSIVWSGDDGMLYDRIVAALAEADAEDGLAPLITGQRGNVYTKFLKPRVQTLLHLDLHRDADDFITAAGNIAGCGLGLTPSSDDLLTGYLATRYLLERDVCARQSLAQAAQAAAKKTNRISATFLLQSGEGLANEAVIDLFRLAGQGQDAGHAIRRILAIGSSSGADMLTGIALALRQHNGGTNSDSV